MPVLIFFIIVVHMINNACIFNRQKLQDEYVRQVGTVFQQWESDLEKAKEQEEKLNVTKSIHLHHIFIIIIFNNFAIQHFCFNSFQNARMLLV